MTAHNVIPFTRPPHIADARTELVKHARAILRRPDRHSHEDVLTACYYARMFGDGADTPYTALRGDPNQFILGLGVAYTF